MNEFDRIEIALRFGANVGVDFVLDLICYPMPVSELIKMCEAYKAKNLAEVKEYTNEKKPASVPVSGEGSPQ